MKLNEVDLLYLRKIMNVICIFKYKYVEIKEISYSLGEIMNMIKFKFLI